MRTICIIFSKFFLTIICAVFIATGASATVFTAVVSGNFNDATTWGGTTPASVLNADAVIIPPGIIVTLTEGQTFAGTSTLVVNGTLITSPGYVPLTLTGGNLSGNGSLVIGNMTFGPLLSLTFNGSIIAGNLTTSGNTVMNPMNLSIGDNLRLTTGVFNFLTGSLTMITGSTIEMAGGTMAAAGSGSINLSNPYNVRYLTTANAGIELTGYGLLGVELNTTGRVKLQNDLVVNGILDLTSGVLDLHNHDLTFGPTSYLSVSGGRIASSANSSITVASTTSLTGQLRFVTGESTVKNLVIAMGSAGNTVMLGNDAVEVTNMLNLVRGKLVLGSSDITIGAGGTVTAGSTGSYLVINGGGRLYEHIAAGNTAYFPVGTLQNYTPVKLTANEGSGADIVNVSVTDAVYVNGMEGLTLGENDPIVRATWYVSNTSTLPVNYTMTVTWNTSMETAIFTHDQAYLSHSANGVWDQHQPYAASANGQQYSITRADIKATGAFMVTGNKKPSGVATPVVGNNDILLYPNPASGTMYYSTDLKPERIEIYDITGTRVSSTGNTGNAISVDALRSGEYTISFTGRDFTRVKRFVKQ